MEYGLSLILIIAIIGGIVAFIGDKLGTKIGKKRIRIFGMRPRNSSILVTVITGFLIAASTIGVSSLLSKNVRTALFGMDKLKSQMIALNYEIDSKNAELNEGKINLETKTKELKFLNSEVENVKAALVNQEYQKRQMEYKLQQAESDYKATLEKLDNSQNEIIGLENVRQHLEFNVHKLEETKNKLEKDLTQLREGDVVFRNGEVLLGAIITPTNDEEKDKLLIQKFLEDLDTLVRKRMKAKTNDKYVFVTPENANEIVKKIQKTQIKMLIRAIAASNVVYGQPAMVKLVAQPYELIYPKGNVVYSDIIIGGDNSDKEIVAFLKEVNKEARLKGVLDNPITGEVGSISGSELYRMIDEVRSYKGRVRIQAYTREDVYTTGPLSIHLRLLQIQK